MFRHLILALAILLCTDAALGRDPAFQVTPADTSLKILLTRWAEQSGRTVRFAPLPLEDIALLDVFRQRPVSRLNAVLDDASFETAIQVIFHEPLVLVKNQEIEAYLDDYAFQTCVFERKLSVLPFSEPSCAVEPTPAIASSGN